jgi:hypothetical protein
MFKLLAVLLVTCAALPAQSDFATLRGRVQDSSQTLVIGARGNVGRDTVYGPGAQTMDLAPVRSFEAAKRAHMELRAEALNALNHSNRGRPDRSVNTPQSDTFTEASTPGREFQSSARLSF